MRESREERELRWAKGKEDREIERILEEELSPEDRRAYRSGAWLLEPERPSTGGAA